MIYTFYSFKGGVGRSMALANVAELLYSRGTKVLMLDFDLEAPGLERFFNVPEAQCNLDEIQNHCGVIDMLLSYQELRSWSVDIPQPNSSPEPDQFPFATEPIAKFIVPIYPENTKGASLSMIPAGQRLDGNFTAYAKRVLDFDWGDFYANWDGEQYFEWLRQELERIADVILIDSRTGVTEMGRGCTYQLADVVVAFVAPNQQNLTGTRMMAESLSNPQLVTEGRHGRALSLIFVPSRLDLSETAKYDDFAKQFNQQLGPLFPEQLQSEHNLFHKLKIPYMADYAYMENVAVRERSRDSRADMIEAFENLTELLNRVSKGSIR
ncbi:ParA family protein [Candidatus Entotheonella palauensis]|uniref:ParA family protein n=1 Tax=Candidatus Entotheonella palauensis TaxID=93172 RepID=UPI000B7FCE40|nr:P-loop NTPase [Candidatus Entotheonella palauensis]